MKKILFLGLIFGAVISTSAYAQPAPPAQSKQPTVDQAEMLQKMKDQFTAPMVAKTGLSEAKVNRVLEINMEIRVQAAADLQGLNAEERTKKLADLKAEKEKRYAAIPLTTEEIKSVYGFFEDLSKNAAEKRN